MSVDEIARRLAKAEENIEALYGKFNGLNASQVRTETTLEHLLIAIGRLEGAIEGIKSKPGQRWDIVLSSLISAVVAAAVALIVRAIGA